MNNIPFFPAFTGNPKSSTTKDKLAEADTADNQEPDDKRFWRGDDDNEDEEGEKSHGAKWALIAILATTFLFVVTVGDYDYDTDGYTTDLGANHLYAGMGGRESDERLYGPQQLHLSMGANSSEIYITWSSKKLPSGPERRDYYVEICQFFEGCVGETRYVPAKVDIRYVMQSEEEKSPDGSRKIRELVSYVAQVKDLVPNSLHVYRAVTELKGRSTLYSKTYQFFSHDFSDPRRTLRFAFLGDLGLINGQSTDRLISDVDYGLHDMIIHNGDFAYDLNTNTGEVGDDFMRKIEPIAARVVYQTSVGNHEVAENFTYYDYRFTMINSGGHNNGHRNNFYYSFNAGPVHFIAFSTEFYYFIKTAGLEALHKQYEWLKKDLELANSSEEREKRPWIIVFGHRPMYCSSKDNDDCTKKTNILRKGLPFTGLYALEKLFYDNGVDVELYSHEHMYERFLPVYDDKVVPNTENSTNPYFNPRAPVHVISGSAGCQEHLDRFKNHTATGSVKQLSQYGFMRIEATRCRIHFEQFSVDPAIGIADEFTIEKTYTRNFPTRELGDRDLDCEMSDDLGECPRGWYPNSCSNYERGNQEPVRRFPSKRTLEELDEITKSSQSDFS